MSAHLLGTAFAADMGTPQRKLVLVKLVDHCHDDGTRIFPAVATLAVAAQCSTRTVQRELKRFLETGLLQLVREGGKGAGNTNEYALNLHALRAISEMGWEAWCADEGGADNAESKGDTVSPLPDEPRVTENAPRVTAATHKGDTRSHPNPQEPLEPSIERERADARTPEGGKGGKPDGSTSGGTTSGEVKRQAEETFKKRFWPKWPGRVVDNRDRALAEFIQLSPEDQEKAITHIQPFHEEQRRRKRTKPLAAATYLKQRKWEHLGGAPDTDAPYLPPFAKVWSSLWLANLIELVHTGDAWRAACQLNDANRGASGTHLRFDRKRNDELIALCESFEKVGTHQERWQRWLAWLEREIRANPQREGRMFMHVKQGRLESLSRIPTDPDRAWWLSLPSDALAAAWGIDLPELHPPPSDIDAADAFK